MDTGSKPGTRWSRTRRRDAADSSVRDAVFRRAEAYLRASIDQLNESDLLSAIEAATPVDTIARVMSAAPAIGLERDPWTEALLRGAAMKQEAVQRAGGLLSSGEVAELLGITVAGVKQRQRRGRLLAVPTSNGEWGYPAKQFSRDGGVHTGLSSVLAAFPAGTSPWIVLTFLVGPVPGRNDGIAFDALSDGETIVTLVEVALTYGEQGAT
jgi:hypothetical protein